MCCINAPKALDSCVCGKLYKGSSKYERHVRRQVFSPLVAEDGNNSDSTGEQPPTCRRMGDYSSRGLILLDFPRPTSAGWETASHPARAHQWRAGRVCGSQGQSSLRFVIPSRILTGPPEFKPALEPNQMSLGRLPAPKHNQMSALG